MSFKLSRAPVSPGLVILAVEPGTQDEELGKGSKHNVGSWHVRSAIPWPVYWSLVNFSSPSCIKWTHDTV